MRGILSDIWFSVRSLRRTPGYTYVAVITLALGMSASIVVFSLIDAAILRPLPYAQPDRLVVPSWYANHTLLSRDISASAFLLLRERARSFQKVAAIYDVESGANLAAGTVEYVRIARVSGDFFSTLGAIPVAGRTFMPDEDLPGSPHTAVLSYGLAIRDFGELSSALNQNIHINGELYTVIGVMPAEFHFHPDADVWTALQLRGAGADPGNDFRVIARLKDDVTPEQAQQELDSSEAYRMVYQLPEQVTSARLVSSRLQDFVVARVREDLFLFLGAVLFVLLIICINLGVLMAVRASTRGHEVALRFALGAGRWLPTRTFLVETLIVCTAGSVLGLLLAKETMPLAARIFPEVLAGSSPKVDSNIFFFAAILAVVSALASGLAPSLRMPYQALLELLKQSPSTATHSRLQTRTGRILVVVQSALTLTLLAAAGLFLRSFLNLRAVKPGFDPRSVMVAQISLASSHYEKTEATNNLLSGLCRQLESQAGVEDCAAVIGLPFERGLNLMIQPAGNPTKAVYAEYRAISPKYFGTMRISILVGRPFLDSDGANGTPVVIVNRSLARRWWSEQGAIGNYISVGSTLGGVLSDVPRQIVGVAADIHETDLSNAPSPTIFVPMRQVPDHTIELANRTLLASILMRTADNRALLEQVRSSITKADSQLPLARFHSMEQLLSDSLHRRRLYTSAITLFGFFALFLTALGLYGMLRHQLILRMREIGIRIAVGAGRFEIVALIVKDGVLLVNGGVVIGLAAAPFAAKLLATLLYNVNITTMFYVVIGAGIVLELVAALTSWVTVMLATYMEPIDVLRSE
jgi:predicted permease